MKNAQVRKTIYSLPDLQDLMRAANRRYLELLSALEDPTDGIKNLEKLSRSTHDGQRTHRGFNLSTARIAPSLKPSFAVSSTSAASKIVTCRHFCPIKTQARSRVSSNDCAPMVWSRRSVAPTSITSLNSVKGSS